MGTVGVVLLVAFVIVCALLVLLVLVQDDGSSGMGGLLGGRGTAAFGSHSASVLTRATFTLVVLFFALALSLALLNRRPNVRRDIAPAGAEASAAAQGQKWYEESSDAKESGTAGAQDAESNADAQSTDNAAESTTESATSESIIEENTTMASEETAESAVEENAGGESAAPSGGQSVTADEGTAENSTASE